MNVFLTQVHRQGYKKLTKTCSFCIYTNKCKLPGVNIVNCIALVDELKN